MALILADRVKETTTSTGTGSITLAGAKTGFQAFSAAIGNGNTTYYCIADQGGANWEVGIGTYNSTGNLLARTTVLESSNANGLVSFGAGTKDVFVTLPSDFTPYNLTASMALVSDANGKVVAHSSVSSTELGYLDGVTSSVQTQLGTKAPIASPTFTGTPAAPTAAQGTNTTQLATTAFVQAEIVSDAAPIAHVGATGAAHGVATTLVNGFMSSTDKSKLDGVAAGATANTGTVTGVTATAPVASSGGTAPVISMAAATASVNGYMTSTYAAKLDGIAAGAQVNSVTSVFGRTGAVTLQASDVPTLNQSTTGNAATATNSNYSYNYTQGFNSNWNTDFQNAPAGSTILRGDTSTGGATGGPGGTWWFQQNMRHSNGTNYWGTQVAWGWEDNANVLKTRNVQGGNFGAWVTYLNSANYNSYSPTLTGGNASGTWGINVTGSAGSVAWGNVSGRPTALSSFTNDSAFVTIENSVPAGAVAHFARSTAPSGWIKANGAAVSRTTYAALFAAIGTTFGTGDGSTTFQLPDLRAEFIRGLDDGRGVDSARALGSNQSHAYQAHQHTFFAAFYGASSTIRPILVGPFNAATYETTLTHSQGTGSGNAAAETRPQNVALLACIKY